jgi:hypothetical protein
LQIDLNYITTYLFNTQKQIKEVGWFRNALYLFIFYKVMVYLFQFKALFSEQRFIYHHVNHINPVVDSAFFLNNHYSVLLALLFIFSVGILSIIGLLRKSNYISNLTLWLLVMNLTSFLYPTLTAGDYLLNQLLFFNCFFMPQASKNSVLTDMKTALHNTALLAIKLQVCLAYFLAGYFKVIDDSWMSGAAIYQTFQIPEFSNALLVSIPYSITVVLTYFTIAYQLSFAFLVWFRPFKIYLFSFGIMQHLLIAFGMGLFQFGVIMCICYILFLNYDNRFPADFADGADK